MRLGVEIFALPGIAAVVRLIEGPAIGHHVEHVGNGRQVFRREFCDVLGIGIETMAKFTIAAERGRWARWDGGTKLRKPRKTRAKFGTADANQRYLERGSFVSIEPKIGNYEGCESLCFDAKFVMAGGKQKDAENTFDARSRAHNL